MNVRIVTDSVSDIPSDLAEKLQITIVPIHISMGEEQFLDNIDLSRSDFYERLPAADPYPTTAAPSPQRFQQVYDRLADEGAEAILSIHVSSSFSAIFQSATKAAENYSRIPVIPVDSGNLTLAEGLVAVKAAEAAVEGRSAEDIAGMLASVIRRTYAFAKLDTIDYLQRSGRMTAIQHRVIGLLGIVPILRMNNGESKMEVARTRKRAFQRILTEGAHVLPHAELFGISHANVPEEAQRLAQALKESIPGLPDPLISGVTPALGVHVGPGALCINWMVDEAHFETEVKGWRRWFSRLSE